MPSRQRKRLWGDNAGEDVSLARYGERGEEDRQSTPTLGYRG